MGHAWAPHQIVTDYEAGILAAIQLQLPRTQILGCYFHFAKALWANVQRFGLVVPYNQDPLVTVLIRKIICIGFLPVHLVRMNYTLLRQQSNYLIVTYPPLGPFFTYIENTWISANATFPPPLWNAFNRPMEFRTNNAVESYNKKWNELVGVFYLYEC